MSLSAPPLPALSPLIVFEVGFLPPPVLIHRSSRLPDLLKLLQNIDPFAPGVEVVLLYSIIYQCMQFVITMPSAGFGPIYY